VPAAQAAGPRRPDVKLRILFVDDEFNVLAAIKRQLHSFSDVELARGGEEALSRLKAHPEQYGAIVSDLKMPGVDGVRLLAQARSVAPDAVRIILTGALDSRQALSAINDAAVFRVLIKPCEPQVLVRALTDALDHHRTSVRQRETAELTSSGMIALLNDLLATLHPLALERGERLQRLARHVIQALHMDEAWLLETAARMSQVGFIALPQQIIEKTATGTQLTPTERARLDGHYEVGARLLGHLPRLAPAGMMLAGQGALSSRSGADDIISIGTRLLRVVNAYDTLLASGLPTSDVITRLEADPASYPPAMVSALGTLGEAPSGGVAWVVVARDLKVGMVFEEDFRSKDNVLLASRGQEVTAALIGRIGTFRDTVGVVEPVRVRVPLEFNQLTAARR
jgi:response regulator RpfG family c-di-GMP phosphodiesterase